VSGPNVIHKYGHTHLDDFVARADLFENELIIASHFSTRPPSRPDPADHREAIARATALAAADLAVDFQRPGAHEKGQEPMLIRQTSAPGPFCSQQSDNFRVP